MNAKKKTLSFALACLMIIMTFGAAIPAFAVSGINPIACKIQGGDSYDSLSSAIAAAKDNDVIILEESGDYDKEYKTSGQYNIMFDDTYMPAKTITIKAEIPVNLRIINGGIVVNKACTINFENINFIQDNKEVTGNTQVMYSPRNASCNVTFTNCSFTFDGDVGANGANRKGYFDHLTNNDGGVLNMNNCVINCNETTAVNPIFSCYNDAKAIKINLNDVTVNVKNDNTPIFRLYTKMTVNIFGNTTFNYVGGETPEAATNIFTQNSSAANRRGGTVNVFNGMTYGVYAAPVLAAGAAIRTVNPSGLRFIAKRTNENAVCGFMLAKYVENIDVNDIGNYKKVEISDSTKFSGDGTYMLSLVNIPDHTQQFAVRAYAEYTAWSVDNNGTLVEAKVNVYSAFDAENNVRSISQVADLIVEEAKAHTTADEVYKYEVGENMYSRYTKSQYDYIVENFATKESVTPV